MSKPRSFDAGFLLTETLATFAISACVLLGLASVAPTLLRAVDRSVTNIQDADDLSRTLAALRRDLSGLSRSRWNGFEPQPFVFRGGPNSLFFAHREHGRDGHAEVHVIALREIVTDGGTRLVRSEARLSPDALSFDDLRFGPQRTLATGPARVRFWYVPAANGARVPSWRMGPRLPVAVEIEAIDAQSTRLIVTTRVPVRANADIGCLSGGGQAPPSPGSGTVASLPPPPGADATTPPPGPLGGSGATSSDVFCGRDDGSPPPPGTPL